MMKRTASSPMTANSSQASPNFLPEPLAKRPVLRRVELLNAIFQGDHVERGVARLAATIG
jgi:hypothetical protein